MEQSGNELSRRSFLKRSTVASAGASAFMIVKPDLVRGAGNEKLKVGLVGCGGRGTQAAQQLLHGNENVELVAMGDLFQSAGLPTDPDQVSALWPTWDGYIAAGQVRTASRWRPGSSGSERTTPRPRTAERGDGMAAVGRSSVYTSALP